MKYEFLHLPRQGGKTVRMIERIAELQDEGYDPVVVIVPVANWIDHMAPMLVEFGADPSRVIVFTEQMIKHGNHRGVRYALAGLDDADVFRDWRLTVREALPGAENDSILFTHSEWII